MSFHPIWKLCWNLGLGAPYDTSMGLRSCSAPGAAKGNTEDAHYAQNLSPDICLLIQCVWNSKRVFDMGMCTEWLKAWMTLCGHLPLRWTGQHSFFFWNTDVHWQVKLHIFRLFWNCLQFTCSKQVPFSLSIQNQFSCFLLVILLFKAAPNTAWNSTCCC